MGQRDLSITHYQKLATKHISVVILVVVYPERRVIGVETFYHPMSLIWHQQDGGETTILQGEWTTTHRGEYRHKSRRELVQVVR